MAFRIIISLAVLTQAINCQVIGNVGSVLTNPTVSAAPVSLANTAFNSPIVSNSGILSNAVSVGKPNAISLNNGLPNGLANAATGLKSGVLAVTSTSPISPIGINVYADSLVLDGTLAVSGQLPYLGTIGFEGSLASTGQGVANCACGNGNVGMVSENSGLGNAVSGKLVY